MTWRVTIRGENGKRKFEDINASNRQELFAILKEKQIVAIRVDPISEAGLKHSSKSTAPLKKIIISLLTFAVILAGAFLLYLFLNEPSKVASAPKPTIRTKPVTQQSQVNTCKVTKVEDVQHAATTNQLETYRDERGILRYKGGLRVVDQNKKTSTLVRAQNQYRSKTSIFKNRAEHEIARLLTMRPGQSMIGMRRYDSRFESDDIKSLSTPIIVKDDDPPDVAAMKRAMIDAKIEISDRMRQGEKLSDILEETRSELMRLSKVKRDIERLVREETQNPNITEGEVADYIAAANKLLEKEGIAPINGSSMIRSNILLKMKGTSK
jgi:hypothetical protein